MDQSHEPREIEAAPTQLAHAPAAAQLPPEGSGFRKRHAAIIVGGAAALAIAFAGGGIALGSFITSSAADTTASSSTSSSDVQTPSELPSGGYHETTPFGGSGDSGTTDGTGGTSTTTTATAATDDQKLGVVTIVSTLDYDSSSQAAGTGVILTSDGEILTNNHVIDGATSIAVTVESTGITYQADVVGTDSTNDIAVLQLVGASGLSTATIDTGTVAVGDDATSIGNAEGTGDLVAAAGTVTATDESITVGNEYTGASESLAGLIEVDADVVSGDSGGPLVDSQGEVIGIVTAASSGSTDITGYAIPISSAMSIVDQIESGEATDTVTIGLPAFLGIQLSQETTTTASGVVVGGVIASTPAETAGLVAGDVITSVDGDSVTTGDALSALIAAHEPGDSVTIGYTDASGTAQTATVTLTEGPAA